MSRSDENTGFVCAQCGQRVEALTNGSYRNHCPSCLYSLHVDEVPGDRASPCRGLMEPIGLRKGKKRMQIVHRCLRCGAVRPNRVAESTAQPDRVEALVRLIAALALALALASAAPLALAQGARSIETIAVSFDFPDGSTKRTTVTVDEVEALTGQRPAYKLLPWVHAALRKLELAHKSSPSKDGGIALSEIGGVANGPRGTWVYSVNGVASPYQLNTQTIEGVKQIAFSYR